MAEVYPSSSVAAHKVRAPSPSGLRRTRLEIRVLEALRGGHILVVAPPGAGKTTLLSQVAVATGLETSWYHAGVAEADAETLLPHLARALWGEAPPTLRRDAGIDALLATLGSEEPAVDRILIIDDLHELSGTPAESALARFLECCPPQLRVLMGSRRPPDFNAPRMMASGDLVQFDGDDLRFRSWEVEELFRDLYQEPLAPEAAALLTRRVGGFAAALQLFHLSTRGYTRVDREAQILQLSGRSPLIRSYLARTVLNSLSAAQRDFLVRTSVLGILSGPTCDALLGRTDSATILGELAAGQLFTTTYDGGLTYQYHQVLRNHLQVMLEDELPAAEVTDLQRRAAELLEQNGCPVAALAAYQRAGDWVSAGRLVRRSPIASAPPGPEFPQGDTSTDPWLSLAHARGLLRRGSIAAGITALEELERSFDDEALIQLCRKERRAAGVWRPGPLLRPPGLAWSAVAAVRLITHDPPGDQLESAASSTTATGQLLLVLAEVITGDFDTARAHFGRMTGFPTAEPWVRLTAKLIAIVLELTEPEGAARGAARLEDLSLVADADGYPWLGRIARGLQACVLLEQTDEAWHRTTCTSVIDSCVRDGDQWGELLLRQAIAVTLARRGHPADARAELERAERLARDLDAPMLRQWVHGYLAALGPTGTGPPTHLAQVCRRSLQARPRASTRQRPPSGRLHCLGGFRLDRAGQPTDLTPLRPRARLLLMRLAIQHGAEVHREHLIEALWPDVALPVGLRRLQVAVSSVRQHLEHAGWGGNCLVRQGDAYRLILADAEVDVVQLEERVAAAGRLRDAGSEVLEREAARLLELYRGELLPEVGTPEWVLPERDRLRVMTASALAALGQRGLHLGRPDLVLEPAQRLVEIDPLRDTAWLLLARIQRALGDHNAAEVTLAAYHRVGATLFQA